MLDFYCCSRRLAIELDGLQHLEPQNLRYDIVRTIFLQDHNIQVVRFMNSEIGTDINSVLDRISSLL